MGYLPNAPYDRIILTVGAWDIAPAWIEQLAPGGCFVLPLALNGTVQKLVAFEKREDHLESVSIRDGSFMPLRGALASPPLLVRLSTDGECILSLGTPRSVDAGTVYDLLTGPYGDIETSIQVTQDDLWGGVGLWLALRAPTMCGLMARGEAASRGIIPATVGRSPSYIATMGLLEDAGLCLLAQSPDGSSAAERAPFTLAIRSYGSDNGPAEHLLELLQEWDRAGRPSSTGLRIRAYPRDAILPIDGGSASIDKPYTKLVLDWSSKDS
jgi:protein-L-isoaspartate(D-aspartate) O-methyltransferase